MAINEHKNLDGDNLHVPKGFTDAVNNSVCTKNGSGAVEWKPIATTGFGQRIVLDFSGYATALINLYKYPVQQSSNNAPFNLNTGYGSATIGSNTQGRSALNQRVCKVMATNVTCAVWKGWITSSGTDNITLALVKWTPTDNQSSALTATEIGSVTVTPNGSSVTRAFEVTSFTTANLTAGDIVMPMIKAASESEEGVTAYFNSSIQLVITS